MCAKIKIIVFSLLLVLSSYPVTAQTVQLLNAGSTASIRGLSVVSDRIVWASGSAGSVGKSTDGGTSWKWVTVKGFEHTDFRDIEAFSNKTAVIMGIGEPAVILRTKDGGTHWKTVYQNNTRGMFLDAMEFWNDESGIVIGDPIDNHFFIARTFNGGKKWQHIPAKYLPVADSGEACFASSGTNIRKLNQQEAVFITGGLKSRLVVRYNKIDLPLVQGKTSTGANSIAIKDKNTFIIVGGDFMAKEDTTKNCCITTDAGKTFTLPLTAPHGYRSCVEYLNKSNWISCGLTGVDYSTDEGKNWNLISNQSFHVCRKAKTGNAVFFAGGGGRLGKLVMP